MDPSKDASLQDLFIIPIRKPLVPGEGVFGTQQLLSHEQVHREHVDPLVTPSLVQVGSLCSRRSLISPSYSRSNKWSSSTPQYELGYSFGV